MTTIETPLPATGVEELRRRLGGQALLPGDPQLQSVRAVYNAMHGGQPGLTIRCRGAADVIDGVRFARDHGVALAVRGGGHSIAGLSASDGGLLLDLSPMNGVQVDPERRLARVEAGALWADVDRETQALGLATPGGVVSDTGVAGLTLGGGYGWLRRKHGLSCDNVVAAQLVCADGRLRTASSEVNPDLFWAIRGASRDVGDTATEIAGVVDDHLLARREKVCDAGFHSRGAGRLQWGNESTLRRPVNLALECDDFVEDVEQVRDPCNRGSASAWRRGRSA